MNNLFRKKRNSGFVGLLALLIVVALSAYFFAKNSEVLFPGKVSSGGAIKNENTKNGGNNQSVIDSAKEAKSMIEKDNIRQTSEVD